ncbi:MAG: ATP-binding cassette domain-containing protein [Muribaculaceae bacterium]|nr:ATP-binding cassette domain-containing protein [Muribaculaceae bacterium]
MESIVDYRNVELSRKELIVLKDVSLKISRGEFVYLIGKVGSGKSTLIKSMYCEIPIENGDATVFGYDLHSIRRKDVPMLRRKIGIVFQDFQLLTDRSVYDNLLFVLRATGWRDKREIDERIETVLKKVGMSNKSYKMPHELSGGEQQRIVIARALLNDPLLILADEPTGNLDPETGHQIISLLSSISKSGTAILMATHNISLVEEFPGRILKCEAKKIIDMGTDYLSWIEK